MDHRDGVKLHNTEANLRRVSHAQNMYNSKGASASRASRYKGVSRGNGRMTGKWRASIRASGKQKHLGYFVTEEEAALAYNSAALSAFGDHAFLNKVVC